MNIDADVAFLAGQNPPIKVFPSVNSTHLPYNEQLAQLKSDYLKHYSYRGDLTYNEKMARSLGSENVKRNKGDSSNYRVIRDKNRFFEARIKDDALILGQILESMIERTSEMEKYLENVLCDAGEKNMPNWDELFEYDGVNSDGLDETNGAKCSKKDSKNTSRSDLSAVSQQVQLQQQPTEQQHQTSSMLVAQMLLARSFAQSN